MSLTVDASVLVSAADRTDSFCSTSRRFLEALAQRRIPVLVPSIAHLEVACALARRLRNTENGRALADALMRSPLLTGVVIDAALLAEAIEHGTKSFLRAGDALYVAVARRAEHTIVSWDSELVNRAGAITPDTWLDQNS